MELVHLSTPQQGSDLSKAGRGHKLSLPSNQIGPVPFTDGVPYHAWSLIRACSLQLSLFKEVLQC